VPRARPRRSVAEFGGERLDRYLVRLGCAPSRRAARELIERGSVLINGRRGSKGTRVAPADRVEVAGEPAVRTAIEPDPELETDILYRDDDLIVVNKPGGRPCHPLRAGEHGTVMNAIVARFPETAVAGDKPNEGGLVHRLDNGTSGALIVARNRESFTKLRAAIRGGRVTRRYEALVAGNVARPLQLAERIAHHPKNPRKMTLGDAASARRKRGGRAAFTAVTPIRRAGANTLVTVMPTTGSRHQIRVHLARAGHPIVGDTLYGGPASDALAAGRFWLHLREMEFDSPRAGRVKISAPLPPELRKLLS
jgi:23S rRNA pseudouridine1911/1915/1917 synthase